MTTCLKGPIQVFVCPFHDRPTDFITIPSKQYAAFTHRGPMEKAESSYCQAWQWMSEHGLKKDHGVLGLERFDQRYQPFRDDPDSHHNEFDLYIPILENA